MPQRDPYSPDPMTGSPNEAAKGMDFLKVAVPAATAQWFRDKAATEGVSQQSLIAPVLNAVARGEIASSFSYRHTPDPHGNARK